jgi:exopolyphosphatase/guanosine-5'-triphosphate,3'-diphosphate pyrophosphatase
MRVAVLDLGSTSFHLSVLEVHPRSGSMERLLRRREMLHLSASVATLGYLPEDLCAKAIRSVRVLRREADGANPDVILAVATSALRDAANGGGLIDRLETAARCPIRVLTGHEEARLAYRAVGEAAPVPDVPLLVCDLGGGSLDIALGIGSDLLHDATFPLGASRLHAIHVDHDPPTAAECDAIAEAVRRHTSDFAKTLAGLGPMAAAATGGTARALARLYVAHSGGEPSTGRNTLIPAGALFAMTSLLTKLSRKERLELPGTRSRRVDVLPVGALVLSTLVEELDIGALAMCEWGMREGVILESMASLHAPPTTRARASA